MKNNGIINKMVGMYIRVCQGSHQGVLLLFSFLHLAFGTRTARSVIGNASTCFELQKMTTFFTQGYLSGRNLRLSRLRESFSSGFWVWLLKAHPKAM